MTNEEIERTARAEAHRLARIVYGVADRMNGRHAHLESQIEIVIAEIAARARAGAYEEAIPLVCKFCADGLPVTQDAGGYYIHIVARAMPAAPDYEKWQHVDAPEGCYAQKLRALKDSLVQEAVPLH